MMSTFEKRYRNRCDGPHTLNLERISKAQKRERCPSPLVHSIARVPLPLQQVSAGDLLWKTLISGLSIFHHSRCLLTPATKAKYLGLCLSINCSDSHWKRKINPQYNVSSTSSPSHLSRLCLFLLESCSQRLLTAQAAHRWYSGLSLRRNTGELGVIGFF